MYGGHRQLTNLTAIVDRNRLQQGDRTENTNSLDPLDAKVEAFGWEARVIDGHDLDALHDAITRPSDRPVAVIAETTKGRGVSFIEDRAEWHHKVPSEEQVALALKELAQ
jgi:transketolase